MPLEAFKLSRTLCVARYCKKKKKVVVGRVDFFQVMYFIHGLNHILCEMMLSMHAPLNSHWCQIAAFASWEEVDLTTTFQDGKSTTSFQDLSVAM